MTFAGRSFRPTFWASVATFIGVAMLLGLGSWQIQRLHWKNDLIAERQAILANAPISLPERIDDPAELALRLVTVTGRFHHAKEFYLAARVYKKQVGFHVVTPLVLADGRQLLVDRGWVPPDRKAPGSRPQSQGSGEVRLDGVLRRGGWKGRELFRPDNDASANLWLWLDLSAMAASGGLDQAMTGLYLQASNQSEPGRFPIPRPYRVDLRNDHFEYAMTWYSLALILIIIYVVYHWNRPRGSVSR